MKNKKFKEDLLKNDKMNTRKISHVHVYTIQAIINMET